MKIFIPEDIKIEIEKKLLFLLVRPFLSNNSFIKHGETFEEWNINPEKIQYVENVNNADVLLIPFTINYYFQNKLTKYLENYSYLCKKDNLKGFGFIEGDYGRNYPDYDHITFFRMNGFRSQLSSVNKGFPAALTDQYKKIYGNEEFIARTKKRKPVIGFCGLATDKNTTYIYQTFNYLKENIVRFLKNPFRNDYEPLFQSGYERFKLLNRLDFNDNFETNFIYRAKYRAGAINKAELKATTRQFYDNIKNSDYIICIRGTGNFSIRMYETLMMGRIPIFINTDCLLPFTEHINWTDHMIIIEWSELHNLEDIILDFHKKISKEDFISFQIKNRKLWENQLQPKWILENLADL